MSSLTRAAKARLGAALLGAMVVCTSAAVLAAVLATLWASGHQVWLVLLSAHLTTIASVVLVRGMVWAPGRPFGVPVASTAIRAANIQAHVTAVLLLLLGWFLLDSPWAFDWAMTASLGVATIQLCLALPWAERADPEGASPPGPLPEILAVTGGALTFALLLRSFPDPVAPPWFTGHDGLIIGPLANLAGVLPVLVLLATCRASAGRLPPAGIAFRRATLVGAIILGTAAMAWQFSVEPPVTGMALRAVHGL